MQIVFGDLVICDYELGATLSPIELELYTSGVQAVPAVLLGDSLTLGSLRRQGVLDIPLTEFVRVRDRFTERIWSAGSAAAARRHLDDLVRRADTLARDVEARILADRNDTDLLRAYHTTLVRLMAYHVLNWWLPVDDYERLLAGLLGPERGRDVLFRLLTPSRQPHMISFHEEILAADRSAPAAAERLARQVGYLQTWGVAASVLESPAAMSQHLLGLDAGEAADGLALLRAARTDARRRRDEALAEALAAAHADPARFDRVEALAIMCQLACDEEEDRRVHQLRGLRNLRAVARLTGTDLTRTSFGQLLNAVARRVRTPIAVVPAMDGR
ncbi:hypothetical protein I0C86_15255 [Plantactinospora sp. S1510]|uniref:Uncharacterized protein n=1 Tax=Plantactinospora alkalitolerans TaxID=2789879 RepID=A0ABS0GWN8_9ACTN|nr:hypothetical protein [Plantactinospora alkalitolerans]MBF9130302.1 hypothetical protein [Plantactinospora alkalitolerans]